MSYIYKVFEHLQQLWMGIWQHTHTVTTTEVSPDLGELAEIIDDVSVGMIPLRYRSSATAAVVNDVPCASRSAVVAFFALSCAANSLPSYSTTTIQYLI